MRERTRKAYWTVWDKDRIRWRFTWDPKAKSLSMRMPRGLVHAISAEELVALLFMTPPQRRGQSDRDDRQLHLFTIPSCSPTPAHVHG